MGQLMYRPNLIPISNRAGEYRGYQQFMSMMADALYPHLVSKKPKEHHSIWGEVAVVVIVAACIIGNVAGGMIASSLAASGTLTFAAIKAAVVAVTVAYASAVEQEVAVQLGWQDHFSIPQAVDTGLEAGIAAGFNEAVAGVQFSDNVVITYAEKAAISGLAEASEQLAQMATGMRKQFDLGRVVAAVAASGIQQKITGRVKTPGSPFDVNQSLQTNIINMAIDDAVNAAIADERISAETLALKALGIATGDVMQRTTMMQTLTRYESEMEKQRYERQANAETRANRTQLTASTQNKTIRNRNSAIDDYLTASTQTLLGQPIPDIELTERNLPSFDDPRWTNVSRNKDAIRLSRWQSTKTSNVENKWVAFGEGFGEAIYDNVSGLMSSGPTSASMTQKMTRIMLGENPIDVFINPTAIKNNLVAMYDDIHSTNPELKGYGWGISLSLGQLLRCRVGWLGMLEE